MVGEGVLSHRQLGGWDPNHLNDPNAIEQHSLLKTLDNARRWRQFHGYTGGGGAPSPGDILNHAASVTAAGHMQNQAAGAMP